MTKYKLINLLHVFKEEEWEGLEAFLRSPYFTTETTSWKICQVLRPCFAGPNEALPEVVDLFHSIWPEDPFDPKALAYAFSRLNKLAERFLVLRQLEQQPARLNLAALQLFSERQLDKHLAASQREMMSRLDATNGQNAEFFLLSSDHAELMDQHYIRQKIRKEDRSIQDAADNLDRFYYLRRLHYACSMLDRQNILDVDYNIGLTEAWLDHLINSPLAEEPMIHLYLTIFRSLRNEEQEDYFQELKANLFNLFHQQPSTTLDEPLLFAINYCARKIRAGNEHYLHEAINLYRTGIDAGILLVGGQLSAWTYTNIVKLCLRLKEHAYAEEFIGKYTKLLPENLRENAYNYNFAELLYATNEKTRAQQYLLQVAYSDLSYYLGARVLLAKILYETGEEETLTSLLASFTVFLQRNRQISRDLKRTYLNFCNLFARILRTPEHKLKQVIDAIRIIQPVTERDWLLEVAESRKLLN